MSETSVAPPARLLPFHNTSRRWRITKVVIWLAGFALVLGLLELVGVDVLGWLRELWDVLDAIPAGYIIAGLALQTVHVLLMALVWYFILQAAFPDAPLLYRQVLAAFAAGVALSEFLPAGIGTLAMLLMFVAMIRGATFARVLGAAIVQKIFFAVVGALVYLYLFLTVAGSFDRHFGGIHEHPGLTLALVAAAAGLLAVLGRIFRGKLEHLWQEAKQGGAILGRPRAYLVKVILPSLGAWLTKLGVTAIFLAGYGIPVTFHTIIAVTGGNSAAGAVSVTPGGVGITQAANIAALDSVTNASTAAAYSVGQQLIVSSWNVVLATILVLWAFGWTGGRKLVERSYADARGKLATHRDERAAKAAARSTSGSDTHEPADPRREDDDGEAAPDR